MRRSLLMVLVCAVAAASLAGCGSKSKSASVATVAGVKAAFLKHGLPLQGPGTVRIAGFTVSALQYDVNKLITGQTTAGQWLVVLVFDAEADASNALHDQREAQAIQGLGLTVITHGNVVATIARGAANQDRITRVRAAVDQATGA